ncbi:hypothetical protein CF68_32930 [Cupriavidus sp. SK-4]|uniref:hypothetical protein n=1 Tax=Cupriavidus sp. SK-4 TaxID=574750 RepID=UPI000449C90D|nr:hypothetical protein [Cupriavidus sp. SK-4]EYS89516.1 hypothetical protein CF68_32930 [Cupriavidus sp. SK-4]
MINDPYSDLLRPPLDDDELRDMWARNRSPEVHALLWEVKRLQNIVRRAWQFQTFFPTQGYLGGSTRDMVLWHLRDELKNEPYLQGAQRWMEEHEAEQQRAAKASERKDRHQPKG